jgi:hypothetical protein
MQDSEIVLTPHHIDYEEYTDRIPESVVRTLMCGIFNSGFVGVRRSPNGLKFLRWWDKQLLHFCYKELSCGLYLEQRWLELSQAFFDITILREPGYNVANWNIAQRELMLNANGDEYLVCGKSLRFFHFSMVDSGRDLYYLKYYLPDDSPLFEIRRKYVDTIRRLDGGRNFAKNQWTYGHFNSGELIAYLTRQRYRNRLSHARRFTDPFDQSNSVISAAAAMAYKNLSM